MGGTVTVRSQVGAGSTFVIQIPLASALRETTPSDAVPLLL